MKVFWFLLLVVVLCLHAGGVRAGYSFRDEPYIPYTRCGAGSVLGQFSSSKSTHQFAGDCTAKPTALLWNAKGAYDRKDGRVDERITLNGFSPYRGEVRTTMFAALARKPVRNGANLLVQLGNF
jgi:hypothetical protein